MQARQAWSSNFDIDMHILTIIPIVASGVSPRCVFFCALAAHFLAPTGAFDLPLKKNAWLRATFSRFAARATPPGLARTPPGRPRPRFSTPKRLFFDRFFALFFECLFYRFLARFSFVFVDRWRSFLRSIFVQVDVCFFVRLRTYDLVKTS